MNHMTLYIFKNK